MTTKLLSKYQLVPPGVLTNDDDCGCVSVTMTIADWADSNDHDPYLE